MNKQFSKKNYYINLFSRTTKLMILENWDLVIVNGKDSFNYLQSQITYNLSLLKNNEHIICSHCTINGKVLSNLRLFKYNNGYAYLQHKSMSKTQINELKKYSIFSEVKIYQKNSIMLLGIIGINIKNKLLNIFSKLPDEKNPVHSENNITILQFNLPCERFLIIINKNNKFLEKIQKLSKKIFNDTIWSALDIASGLPVINKITSKKFFPQSLNMDILNGLDFNKGCYYGQENISKIHFKKLNKYRLYWLVGKSFSNPKIGTVIAIKKNNIIYNCGWILSIANVHNNHIWIQAVLKNNNNYNNYTVHIKNNPNSKFYVNNNYLPKCNITI